jgi:disease resistance protein RPS2
LGTLNHLKVVVTSVGLSNAWRSLHDAADLPIRSLSLEKSAANKELRSLSVKKSAANKELHLYDILSLNFVQTTLFELDISFDRSVTDITLIQRPEQQPYSFGILSNLIMRGLEELITVKWIGTSPTSVFPRLTCLTVSGCIELEHLSWAMYLPCLEKLDVVFSDSMRQAFTRYHVDNVWCGHESSQTFPCLKELHFGDCESLVTIADPDVTFPSLEVLEISHCPDLKKLPFDMTSLPPSLKVLLMDRNKGWERLELEEGVKSFLQPKLQYYYDH